MPSKKIKRRFRCITLRWCEESTTVFLTPKKGYTPETSVHLKTFDTF